MENLKVATIAGSAFHGAGSLAELIKFHEVLSLVTVQHYSLCILNGEYVGAGSLAELIKFHEVLSLVTVQHYSMHSEWKGVVWVWCGVLTGRDCICGWQHVPCIHGLFM